MTGEELKAELGITKFKQAFIQKVMNSPVQIYIVTVDSRYPTKYISTGRLKSSRVANLLDSKDGEMKKLTPPIRLDNFTGTVSKRSFILLRDLSGDNFIDNRLYD